MKDGETWVYDLATNTWTNQNPTSTPGIRCDHAMAYLGDDQVLMFGGSDLNYSYTSSCWKYDLSENSWSETNPPTRPGSRRWHDMSYIGDGKVILVGGQLELTGYSGDTWLYERDGDNWIEKSGLGYGIFKHSVAYIGDDKILLSGIQKSDGVVDAAYIFDLSDNTWTQKASLPAARTAGDMVFIGSNQAMYFGGMSVDYWYKNDTYVYDSNTNSWSTDVNEAKPSERYNHRMVESSIDGSSRIILFGGENGGYKDDTWTFGGGDYSLPAELTVFTAECKSGAVLLKWTTESEIENLGFIIERKTVGANHDLPFDWSEIASYATDKSLAGHGSTSERHEYQFTDQAIVPGATHCYRIADVDYSGTVTWHKEIEIKVEADDGQLPLAFGLPRVHPNPFNLRTTIAYQLPKTEFVKITVYDITGRQVDVLVSELKAAGTYHIDWEPRTLAAGIYLIQMQAGRFTSMRKCLMVK